MNRGTQRTRHRKHGQFVGSQLGVGLSEVKFAWQTGKIRKIISCKNLSNENLMGLQMLHKSGCDVVSNYQLVIYFAFVSSLTVVVSMTLYTFEKALKC